MELCMSHPGIKRLGSGQWRVRVTRTDERSGRRLDDRKLVQGSLRDALEEQARMRVALDEERPQRIRLRDYAAGWYERNKMRWRHSTQRRVAEHLDEVARSSIGLLWLDRVTPGDVERLLADLSAGRRPARPGDVLGAHSLRGLLVLLRRVARDAARDVGIGDFTSGVTCPVRPEGYTEDAPNCLTRPQLAALWQAAAGSVWLGPIALTGVLGMRTCEVFALRWRDVEEGRIVLRQAVYRGHFGPPKTAGSRRTLPLPEGVLAALPARGEPDALVFPNADGRVYKAPSKRFGDELARLCKLAGVPRVTPHGLRRTANTALVDASVPGEIVRSIIGHSDASMTQHYYHGSAEAKHHAINQALAGLTVALPVALDPADRPN
jgi:integrase